MKPTGPRSDVAMPFMLFYSIWKTAGSRSLRECLSLRCRLIGYDGGGVTEKLDGDVFARVQRMPKASFADHEKPNTEASPGSNPGCMGGLGRRQIADNEKPSPHIANVGERIGSRPREHPNCRKPMNSFHSLLCHEHLSGGINFSTGDWLADRR